LKGHNLLLEPSPDHRPTLQSSHGANFYDREAQILHVTIQNSTPIDIFTGDVVVVTFGIPPVKPDDFFDSGDLVNTLASFLGVGLAFDLCTS